ncbi:hypothetical protein RvY_06052 [Ramazzottius varieornatus]|uniref:Uncharacterized protein n=1 Tax=Ramazzottius varieornatus TaxID=947166 RepID=A0A1D1UXP7_RAMVA|nr:hypothetical protein RvY_06052 [Ramazzottius varieornatus]
MHRCARKIKVFQEVSPLPNSDPTFSPVIPKQTIISRIFLILIINEATRTEQASYREGAQKSSYCREALISIVAKFRRSSNSRTSTTFHSPKTNIATLEHP